MASWVPASVAAVYWKVSVEEIMEQGREGRIASKTEMGVTMVDIASSDADLPVISMADDVSEAELEALTDNIMEDIAAAEPVARKPTADDLLSDLEQSALRDTFDWRASRRIAGAARRPPGRSRR